MKFLDYLKMLKEDGEGGDEGDGVSNPSSTTNIASADYPIGMISRLKMPQILHKGMFSLFADDLKLNGHSHKPIKIKRKQLKPSQSEFNNDKVKNIADSIIDGTYKAEPILVSKDNYVVDGHHRWAAHKPDQHIDTNQVSLTFNELYDFLQNKPYIVSRDVKS